MTVLLFAPFARLNAADDAPVRFDRDIRPILSENCYACHGPGTQEAGLRLDSHEAATAALDSGSRAIVAGDQKASEMLARIVATDPDVVMPPPNSHKTLSAEQRNLLTKWIAAGAPYEQHWSFRPVVRPEVPAAADPAVTNPVDRFLEARLAEAKLPVNPEADRRTLLRRLSFALTGLPPTPAEVDTFVANTSPDAYEKQVERLLKSVHHGEEMARHWLDAARYGDTHGLHLDNERQMWAYRDWVVKALNDNMPFDQFTIWQLAGDLLPAATLEQRVATGFSRCNVTTSEGGSINDELLFRYAVDRTATMTNAFMGLTGQCAVCHDHKFDPVSQKEFYSLYAFFNSAADPGMDGNKIDTPPVIKVPSPAQQEQIAALDAARPGLEKAVADAFAAVDYVDAATLDSSRESQQLETAETVDAQAADPTRSFAAWWKARTGKGKLADVPKELRGLVKAGPKKTTKPEDVERIRRHWLSTVWAARPEALTAAMAALEANGKAKAELEKQFPLTFVFADQPKMRDSFVMQRGAYDSPGEKVERGTPAFLPAMVVAEGKTPDRLDLAKWLVSAKHPLTPRVAANRLWQQFFGVGLVKTSEDFGLQGEPPAHPELLDWLAAEYREVGWNTRHMVKLLVTSRAFRRASEVGPEQLAADPENRLLARGPRFRLDAEQIRDNALAVSGLLVRTLGGKGVKPYQPPNIWEPVGFGNSNTRYYKQDSGEALYRRTMYLFVKRTAPHPALVNFDAPNREQFCARRERSNTPLQALQLMNDIQHIEAARALAARTLIEAPADDAARIDWLYKTVLARSPSADEAKIVAGVVTGSRARYKSDVDAASKAIAHGESKPPAGLAPAELAAWTLVANMVLNLDETLSRN
jgi:mono/diheme cytochrome c family protein